MKKIILLAATIAATLLSCDKEEVPALEFTVNEDIVNENILFYSGSIQMQFIKYKKAKSFDLAPHHF